MFSIYANCIVYASYGRGFISSSKIFTGNLLVKLKVSKPALDFCTAIIGGNVS